MTHIESEINKIIRGGIIKGSVNKTLSTTKSALNSSSDGIVEAVHCFADNIEDEIDESVEGITGKAAGWIVGKATKTVGGICGGVVAGTLKTVAMAIPESKSPKHPEIDLRIANMVNNYQLPTEKQLLFELLQWLHAQIKSNRSHYGKNTIKAFRELHSRAYSTLSVVAKDDSEMIALAKSYSPKKIFGLF